MYGQCYIIHIYELKPPVYPYWKNLHVDARGPFVINLYTGGDSSARVFRVLKCQV